MKIQKKNTIKFENEAGRARDEAGRARDRYRMYCLQGPVSEKVKIKNRSEIEISYFGMT